MKANDDESKITKTMSFPGYHQNRFAVTHALRH